MLDFRWFLALFWLKKDSESFTHIESNQNHESLCNSYYPSEDSGLTIPITKNIIRPWFNYD